MNFSGIIRYICGHRTIIVVVLCLFELCLVSRSIAGTGKKADEKVYLFHADELRYDQYGPVHDAQIVFILRTRGRACGVTVLTSISNPTR